MNMTDLEVDVFFGQWTGRVIDDVFKAFQALIELLLLLVYYSETKVDFIGLFKVRRHAHDLRESLFGVVEGSITIIQDTNAVPQFGLLERKLALINLTEYRDKPWDLSGDRAPAGTKCRLPAGCPS